MSPTISLQLYTLRELTQIDMLGTLDKVAALGYQGVEFAGYGNVDSAAVKTKLVETGLKITGNHVGLEFLENDATLEAVIAENKELGNEYIIVGYLDESRRGSLENWQKTAAVLENVGRKLREASIKLCYHNHAFEFEEQYEGLYGYDILFSSADAQYVQTEIDCYWVQKGGENPAEYLKKYAGRIPLVHIKDMDANGNFAEVGEGSLDWSAIFAAAEDGGTHTYVVEQDICQGNPLESVALSIANLRRMGLLDIQRDS